MCGTRHTTFREDAPVTIAGRLGRFILSNFAKTWVRRLGFGGEDVLGLWDAQEKKVWSNFLLDALNTAWDKPPLEAAAVPFCEPCETAVSPPNLTIAPNGTVTFPK